LGFAGLGFGRGLDFGAVRWTGCCVVGSELGAVGVLAPVPVEVAWTTARRTIGVPAAAVRRATRRARAASRRVAARRAAALGFAVGRAAGVKGTPTSVTTGGRAGTACG
jgi:hypothetical protein